MGDYSLDFINERDRAEFLELVSLAVQRLDKLAQIQALTGGLAMTHRANETFELHARLERWERTLRDQVRGEDGGR